MNNDDLYLQKITQQFDYSSQFINNGNQNDDKCMDLLDKLTFDENTTNFITNEFPSSIIEVKDDKYCQEIISALEKKDFSRILTLAISQSQTDQKNSGLLSETIQEIENSSNKHDDVKIMELIHNVIRSQPKSIVSTPLRATVAPIRNESIVSSSSSNMSNGSGPRSNKSLVNKNQSQSVPACDFMSSDCKLPQIARNLSVNSVQIPNRSLASQCVPIRSNEQRKIQRHDTDIDQLQSIQPQIPFYSNHQNQQQMQYVPLNMSQFSQYPSSLMSPNIVLMPMITSSQHQQCDHLHDGNTVSYSMSSSSNGPISQTTSNNVSTNHNNQISLLLNSAAFFSMPNNQQSINNQTTITTSHEIISTGIGTNTTSVIRSSALAHGSSSNLPKLLPKPQQSVISSNTQQYSNPMQQHSQIHMTAVQQPQHQFKRPTNRKAAVKGRSTSSKSAKGSCGNFQLKKDNVAVAWEIAEQSGTAEEIVIHQSTTPASFVTELTTVTPDEFCLLQSGGGGVQHDTLGLLCTDPQLTGAVKHEFDDLLDDLVTMSSDKICHAQFEVMVVEHETCVMQLNYVKYCHPVHMVRCDMLFSLAVSKRTVPSSNSVFIVRQSSIDSDFNLPIRSANVDSQRVMQFLYAHFGRHSANLLSPLLKCLLPPISVPVTNTNSLIHLHQTGPLSVCTRLSEQDELTEDDLMADISPIKRDPGRLANLDRFLESCQSVSSSSSLQEYCEEQSFEVHQKHVFLPFQVMSYTSDPSAILKLQNFCISLTDGQETPWLRKSKQRSQWIWNGISVRCNKTLDVPLISKSTSNLESVLYTESTILRKKSAFKKLGLIHVQKKIGKKRELQRKKKTIKYLEKIREIRKMIQGNSEDFVGFEKITQLNKRVIGQKCKSSRNKKKVVEKIENTDHKDDFCVKSIKLPFRNQVPNTECSIIEENDISKKNSLKIRISMSKLKVLSITTEGSPKPVLMSSQFLRKIIKPPQRTKMKQKTNLVPPLLQKPGKKLAEFKTKRIFCTRKEDRRSSIFKSISSPENCRKSLIKKGKLNQFVSELPPLILKIPAQKKDSSDAIDQSDDEEEISEKNLLNCANFQYPKTTGNLKLRLKRFQDYLSANSILMQESTTSPNEMPGIVNNNDFRFSDVAINLPLPPSKLTQRTRIQSTALKFSPTHSNSDSDVINANNEIYNFLQRQETHDPILVSVVTTNSDMTPKKKSASPFSQIQSHVSYLLGSDPTVFIDPHEFELVVVKNSKYKKISKQDYSVPVEVVKNATEGAIVETIADEVFVPGCFMEEEKSSYILSWSNYSSPSMPVLAPQEPFSTNVDIGRSHNSLSYNYCNPTLIVSQSYTEQAETFQQSPLCMTTSITNSLPQTSQYSEPLKSPYRHTSYYQPQPYNGSCYLQDMVITNKSISLPSLSKTQYIHSSPTASLQQQNITCSSQIQDYSSYFQNNSTEIQGGGDVVPELHMKNEADALEKPFSSTEPISSSSVSLTSTYQPITEVPPLKSSKPKRPNSNRSHSMEQKVVLQQSKKQRKEVQQSTSQLPLYPTSTKNYNSVSTTAAQYSNFDYYNGFSDIMSGIDPAKLYEQWTLEQLCPTNFPWVAEYCKQAANLMPQIMSPSGFGLDGSNPLSLTSSLPTTDYSTDFSNSAESFKPLSYLDPYYAYTMSQPYMHPSFGIHK